MCNANNSTYVACNATADIADLKEGESIQIGVVNPSIESDFIHFKSPIATLEITTPIADL